MPIAVNRRARVVLLVLALLLAATAVVSVILLSEADDAVEPAPPFNSSRVKAVSWQPRIFLYKGFLSDAECDHLVSLVSRKRMINLHVRSGKKMGLGQNTSDLRGAG
jgi:prolyl 4-hydroxylase